MYLRVEASSTLQVALLCVVTTRTHACTHTHTLKRGEESCSHYVEE
jgi:hypothetical protein